jgi:hypothetical protein
MNLLSRNVAIDQSKVFAPRPFTMIMYDIPQKMEGEGMP